LFWTDKWLPGGRSVAEVYPALASFARKSSVTVAQALKRNRWIRDIRGGISTAAMGQYLHLWDLISTIHLNHEEDDKLIWKFSADGCFSTSSAYNLFFAANIHFSCAKAIWKSKAPPRCKFFMWLAVHRRCLTADNLERRGWPCTTTCQLCLSESETCTHLFVHCSFAAQVWQQIRSWTAADFPIPSDHFTSTEDWWLQVRKYAPKSIRRDFDAVVILVH
jgi:hypothetical protein